MAPVERAGLFPCLTDGLPDLAPPPGDPWTLNLLLLPSHTAHPHLAPSFSSLSISFLSFAFAVAVAFAVLSSFRSPGR